MFSVQIEASLIKGSFGGFVYMVAPWAQQKKNSTIAKVVEYRCLEFKSKPPLSKGGLEGLSI